LRYTSIPAYFIFGFTENLKLLLDSLYILLKNILVFHHLASLIILQSKYIGEYANSPRLRSLYPTEVLFAYVSTGFISHPYYS